MQELWSHILQTMFERKNFSDASFNLWLKDLELIDMTDTALYVQVPNDFKLNFVSKKYMEFISSTVKDILGFATQIVMVSLESAEPDVAGAIAEFLETGEEKKFIFCYGKAEAQSASKPPVIPPVTEETAPAAPKEEAPAAPEFPKREPWEEGMDPGVGTYLSYSDKFTFDNFIVGSTNRFAYNACRAVAAKPADRYNPLFIWGPSGLGKTHLLYAITHEIIQNNPDARVLYVRGEDFTNQLVETLTLKEPMHYFREKYRNVDVLLVDDIHFIAGKVSTQEEFFHTFNALHQQNKQIILTADCPPKEMQTLEERLKSRFEWGLMADIQPPDLELRIAILHRKCEEMGVDIDQEVLEYIANQIKDNIRQLEGAVKKLTAFSFINGQPITLSLAKSCMRDIVSGSEPASVTIDKIFKSVCAKYEVPMSEIRGKRRTREVVQARHMAVYLLSKLVDLPSTNIAKLFEQDHSSILYAINTLESKVKNDPAFRETVEELMKKIRG